VNLHSQFNNTQNSALLRALKTIALADLELSGPEREFIESVGHHFAAGDAVLDNLSTIAPEELAKTFPFILDRATVLDFCILLALVNGKTCREQELQLDAMESAFEFKSVELDVYRDIRANRPRRISAVLDEQGFGGLSMRARRRKYPVASMIQRMKMRLGVNNVGLTRRYRSYAEFDRGTLGREYYEFIVRNELPFPGEAAPWEHLVHHDLAHVLGDFGTSAEEEILVVTFQAASQKFNPFFSVMTGICLFHLGLETSGANVVEPQTMQWQPGSFFRELRRGSNCLVDFSDGWDFRPYMSMSLDAARSSLGISPRTSVR
jgi:hypothetical protein